VDAPTSGSGDDLQIDPALRQLLLRRTGATSPPQAAEEVGREVVPVLARLTSAGAVVPGLGIVARFGPVVTARVRLSDLFDVRRHPAVISLKASNRMAPTLAVSVPEIRARPSDLRAGGVGGLTGSGVTVAILDWGLDFGHANLRKKDGTTRVRALWDQRGGGQPSSPAPFGYGRVFSRDELDRALRSPNPYAHGYDPTSIDPRGVGTHGMHVADIAVGNGRAPGSSPGVAPEAELLFVHLRGDDTRPEDDLTDSVRLLEGVRWAVDVGGVPLVVHMSLGRTGGSHDASPLVVQALDHLLATQPGVAVVMSCGNYLDARLHSHVRVPADGSVSLGWEVPTPGPEPSELEVWYDGRDRFRAILVDPSGRLVADLPPDAEAAVRDASGAVRVSGFHRIGNPGNGANQVDLFLWPGAQRGAWAVVLHGEQVQVGDADAYIERTGPRHQSRFVPDVATSWGSTNSVCNGWLPLSVGAYDPRAPSRPPGSFSSAGPARDGRPKPDVSAPGVGIQAARSAVQRADGTWSRDGLTHKSGTSMAAPHVTGVVALLFQAVAPRLLPMALTRWIVMESARRDPPSTAADELRYGAGRVDARSACTLARALIAQPPLAAPSRVLAPTLVESINHREEPMAVRSETDPATSPLELSPAQWTLPRDWSSVEEVTGQLQLAGTALTVEPRPPADRAPDLDAAVRSALRRPTGHTLVQAAAGGSGYEVLQFGPATSLPTPVVASFDTHSPVLVMLVNGGQRVFLCADPTTPSLRWVDVPGLAPFYTLPQADQDRQRSAWAAAASRAVPGLTTSAARTLGIPLLRTTLAHAGARAFPVGTVRRGDPPSDVGGIVNGITLPVLSAPLSEPACYLPVIAEVEGKLESINAWDLAAGLSLGPIQFNVDRAALFRFLWRLWSDDRDLFAASFTTPFGWSMVWDGDHADLTVLAGTATETLHGRGGEADRMRAATYLQTGQVGGQGRDGPWRRRVAAQFRDVVVWPHVQQMITDVSSWWLTPALRTIQAAGIGPLDPTDPDRKVFVLTALLLSAGVRFSGSLQPLLSGLRQWPTIAEQLAHWPDALASAGSRFSSLEPRLRRQQRDAEHVHSQARALLRNASAAESPIGLEASAEAVDATAAAPAPSAPRGVVRPLLGTRLNADAQAWSLAQHPAVSGLAAGEVAARLGAYVDLRAVSAAVAAAGVPKGSGTWSGDLVEAVHQFQRAHYAEEGQSDGKAGASTLDTLGLVDRRGLTSVRRANRTAQGRLDRLGGSVRTATGGEFTAATWWGGMVDPAVVGRRTKNGMHVILARRLRQAEAWLLAQPSYQGLTPAGLGYILGIDEEHKGARPSAATASMHTYGLAVDIRYSSNPWIVGQHVDRSGGTPSPAGQVTQQANRHMGEVIGRAALLIDGERISFDGHYLHGLRTLPSGAVWDDLHRRDAAFRRYLSVGDDSVQALQLVEARRAAGVTGVVGSGESPEAAARRWQEQAAADLAALRAGSVHRHNGRGHEVAVAQSNFVGRDPCNGFLNLARDLVVALREVAGLAWGAVDFGENESGDVMHFDCRLDGVGQLLHGR
jgi:subtilisin family serine protease